ncbi:MAG: PEP-CTERM sorting domain-containing protein, partial [Chitinispirillaceae bacterium]|nr:PEP-CTERM sorting domain-containing protein [Chitinispirillaceae bacterium]
IFDPFYSVIKITPTTILDPVVWSGAPRQKANPYKNGKGGQIIVSDLSFTQEPIGSDSYWLRGIDLSKIPGFTGTNFRVHLTMSCGNDLLIGQVSEPGIITLLALGLSTVGFAFIRRKK